MKKKSLNMICVISNKEELGEHKATNHEYQKFEDMEEWEK